MFRLAELLEDGGEGYIDEDKLTDSDEPSVGGYSTSFSTSIDLCHILVVWF